MKKYLIGSIIFLLAVFVIYNSVYFEKLDYKKDQERKKNFNPKESVDFLLNNKLDAILESAISIKYFDSLLVANRNELITKYGKSVGISSNNSFLVKGETSTTLPDAEEIPITLANSGAKYKLRLKYIFGNTARDAVGYFKVDDFENTMDFNSVATELNSHILKDVIADKFKTLQEGTKVKFIGAVEINSDNISKELDIVPLKIEIIK